MVKYFREFIFIGILLWVILDRRFLKKQQKQINGKNTTAILYEIGSIGAGLLILLYYLLNEYALEYIDDFFYWLWIPVLCICLLLMVEARCCMRNRIFYYARFWKKRTRQAMIFIGICLGIFLVTWYSICLKQRIFWPGHYQLVREEASRIADPGVSLHIPWVIEGKYVTTRNKKQEDIIPFSKKKLYFQFYSRKELVGSQFHLELFHHGKWYQLKEKERIGQGETKVSERQWIPLSEEEHYEIDLNYFEGVIPGYYRICINIEDRGCVDTYFWLE